MDKQEARAFGDLLRQQMDFARGITLIEESIEDCNQMRKVASEDAGMQIFWLSTRLRRAVSLMRNLGLPMSPRDVDDGVHKHLHEIHEWMECAMGFFFLFQKEWEEGYAQDLEGHCAGLHEASKALVRHLEEVGFK